jgi:hypothetical protein
VFSSLHRGCGNSGIHNTLTNSHGIFPQLIPNNDSICERKRSQVEMGPGLLFRCGPGKAKLINAEGRLAHERRRDDTLHLTSPSSD